MAVEPVKLIRRTCGLSTSSSPIGPASPRRVRHDVEDARRQARLGEDLAPQQAADVRRLLGRLQDDGVPEDERRGDRAGREDQRRVPRRDRADHADRPAHAHRERARQVGRQDRRPSARRRPPPPGGRAPARTPSGTSRTRSCTRSRARAIRRSRRGGSRGRRPPSGRSPWRTTGGVCDHSGNAAAAASTARRASSRSPAATWATTSPVNGSVSSNRRAPPGSTHSPAMKCRHSRMVVSVVLM